MSSLFFLFETDLGWGGIAGCDGRISRVLLPREDKADVIADLVQNSPCEPVESKQDFSGIAAGIQSYFAGVRVDFECEIAPAHAGAFDLDVWNAARSIGYGEVQTYGWIADKIGKPGAARAVGGALGRNPIPVIVPCHRVVRADGGLGGFNSGINWKIRLLAMEKVNE